MGYRESEVWAGGAAIFSKMFGMNLPEEKTMEWQWDALESGEREADGRNGLCPSLRWDCDCTFPKHQRQHKRRGEKVGESRGWGGKKLSDCMSLKVKGESKLFIKWFLGKWLKKLLSWKWKFACSVQFRCSVVSNSLWPHGLCVPGFPVHHQLPSLLRLMSIESVMPPSYLILCCPLLLRSIFPSIRVFSSESVLCIRWPIYWSFSFSISPPNEYLGLISFRNDFLDLLAVQGTLKSVLQHYSSKASIVQPSAFFIVQLSHPYMTAGKTVALTRWALVGKVMSLLFNMLSGLS